MSGRNNGSQGSGSRGGNNGSQGWQSIPNSQIHQSWGGQQNFMNSYGLKPTPEGYAEARAITDAFKQNDYAASQGNGGGGRK
ncbi:hypothetical protein BGZ83_004340 [Gryganskiella cystojenkinii]|nr:hypothetical protein BGZ83_004340 [Gryganskiella cystojenkinii]